MSFPMPDLLPAYAEIFLVAMVSVILITDLVIPGRDRSVTYGLSMLTLLGCAVLTVGTVQATGGIVAFTFSNMFVSDYMGNLLKLLTYCAVAACLVYSRAYMSDRDLLKGEFFVLVLFAMLGMMVMISANHFVTLYLGLELLSLCLYALVALNRDSPRSTEAAMKYFVLGALASGLLLYGMSMIYGATGSLEISAVAHALEGGRPVKTVMVFGLVFVVAGLGFKLGVAPFHMWIPDVYDGAPTAITLFIGSAPKLAAFAMAMRLLVNGLLALAVDWQQMLLIMSVLSMAIGNLAALAQTNIKRMLAYSTISHMGFLLLGLLSGVVDNNWFNAADAYSASMFYAVVYVLMSLGAFGIVILLSRAGFEAENLSSFKGLNRRSPWFAFIMLLMMFSLAGIPPTAGFYAKLTVLQATIAAGQVWLAVVAVMFSLVGAFYYLRVVKLMYFDDAQDTTPVVVHLDMGVLLSANGLAVLLLGILPGPLMQLCFFSIKTL
ncbi:MAG: NADH-quinone oxidoreductase subunit N [Betaproteobacteria bacterium RIFCSPLOWO2_12_FULL_63_13]|nr:MAG: NADH-quinone oxidoreductase subunit N [Betaproteobacteria bacterium RIFCSPLOWO2_02_FULL_63_19]OGA50789.1 MAG: NADH-quinone oxidoreductase subunit N [Betaproteobacteria bacterium RIFCSPLOWO2_12_FULL_63_13]